MSGAPWLERLPDDSEKQREGDRPGRPLGGGQQAGPAHRCGGGGALALVFWGRPTGKVVLGLTLALLVTLAIIEFPARPARVTAAP
jgi:hypothetical protein